MKNRPLKKTATFLTITALLVISLCQYGCSSGPSSEAEAEHRKKTMAHRQTKDAYFRNPLTSPLAPGQIPRFTGLHYFPVDYSYSVPARLEPVRDPEPIQIQTSTGKFRDYLKTGRLIFTVAGQECRLAVYQEKNGANPDHLFVPFTDKTSGHETYGAGRYLEISLPPSPSSITVDFNLAYNPYCAYNYNYSCPFPPEENQLPVRITAGEKDFPHQ